MSATKENRRGWALSRSWSFSNPPDKGSGTDIATKTALDTIFHSDSVPDWQDMIARGSSATTELRGTKSFLHFPDGYYYQTNVNPTVWSHQEGQLHLGFQGALTTAPETIDSTADYLARSKLLASYIKAQSNWRGGNFMAEIGEQVKGYAKLRDAAEGHFKGLANACASFKNANPIRYAKLLAAAWLAFRFVAKPLYDDINDAAEALAEHLNGVRHDTFPVKGKGKSTTQTQSVVGWAGSLGSNGWKCNKSTVTEFQIKYYGDCIAEPSSRRSFQRFGMDVFDVLPAVWEAVPWSFFVDYFVNVNEMLDSMRYWNARIAWLNSGVKNTTTVTYSSPYGPARTGNVFARGGSGPAILRGSFFHRTAITSMPYPGFRLKNPFTSLVRTTNIAALAALVKGSRPRHRVGNTHVTG